jgi:hypothetical protein
MAAAPAGRDRQQQAAGDVAARQAWRLGHLRVPFPQAARLEPAPDPAGRHVAAFQPFAAGYVDIICIEACSSVQNLLDKRSRFAPSTSSLLACCPVPWLLAPAEPDDDVPVPRWRLIRMLHREPAAPLVLPVRDVRVLYGLKRRHYEAFMQSQVAHAHEFFCPMEALTAEDGHEDPDMRALIARASAAANFMRTRRSDEPAGRAAAAPAAAAAAAAGL